MTPRGGRQGMGLQAGGAVQAGRGLQAGRRTWVHHRRVLHARPPQAVVLLPLGRVAQDLIRLAQNLRHQGGAPRAAWRARGVRPRAGGWVGQRGAAKWAVAL